MSEHKVTRQDMELTQPRTLKELVIEELHSANCDNYQQGKPVERLDEESVKELLDRIYEHIEKQALEVYHTTAPWALKAWAYSNILKDVIASEDSDGMVSELMSPVFDWQAGQDFDPIAHLADILDIEGKSHRTREAYMQTATRFVVRSGKKRNYSDEEILEYLKWARKKYPADKEGNEITSSFHHECRRLLQFLRRLPGADKRRDLPVQIPPLLEECYQPTLSDKEVETLIWATVVLDIEPDMVVRLLASSIYGARLSELAELSSEDFHLDGTDSTIRLRVLKQKGRKVHRTQPIPAELVPLFDCPIEPMPQPRLSRNLRKICKEAGVDLQYRAGFHSVRRNTITTVRKEEKSDLNIHRFLRWSEPRQFSMLARYDKGRPEETDASVLDKHPYVKIWEQACPYILQYNTHYQTTIDIT